MPNPTLESLSRELSAARETIAALRGRAEKAERDLGGALETRPDRARMFDCEAWDGAMDALGKAHERATRAEAALSASRDNEEKARGERDRLAVALGECVETLSGLVTNYRNRDAVPTARSTTGGPAHLPGARAATPSTGSDGRE